MDLYRHGRGVMRVLAAHQSGPIRFRPVSNLGWVSCLAYLTGGGPGFYLTGWGGKGATLRNGVTPINYIVLFLQNASYIRKPPVILGWWVSPSAPSPYIRPCLKPLSEVFLRVHRFSSLLENQHFQIEFDQYFKMIFLWEMPVQWFYGWWSDEQSAFQPWLESLHCVLG